MSANLIPLQRAQRIVAEHVRPLPIETVPLDLALGRILAEDIRSDMDYPPFDKAMMDGYAVRTADFADGTATLEVLSEVAAGDIPGPTIQPGQATPISTGAPVPPGADAVVEVERSTLSPNGRSVQLRDRPKPGKSIATRAQDVAAGQTVLNAGTQLGPCQITAAAAAGATILTVHRKPTVAVLSSGSELVPPENKPQGAQIRNSNGNYLLAAVRQCRIEPRSLGIVPDDRDALRAALEEGLRSDVLISTGGVSVGLHDLVPESLVELGVTVRFRKVAIKPGKPILFGTREPGTLVFALPGNPVSCFIGMWLLVRPALDALQGIEINFPAAVAATTDAPLHLAGDRDVFRPARVRVTERGELVVSPVRWQGSGDLFGLAQANALTLQPARSQALQPGDRVEIIPLPDWDRPQDR